MHSKLFKFTVMLVAVFFHAYAVEITPTELYLCEHSIDEIEGYAWSDMFRKQIPFFLKVIEHEQEEGFFGYHACSQRYRIFQDVLRALFEERFEMAIPKDFQFLRIPGEAAFDFKNNIDDFYLRFDRKKLSKTDQLHILDKLFISKFNQHFGTAVLASQLSESEFKALWSIVLDFVDTLDILAREDYYSFDDQAHENGNPFPKAKKLAKKGLEDIDIDDPGYRYIQSIQKKLTSIIASLEAEEAKEAEEAQKHEGKLKKKFFQNHKAQTQLLHLFTNKLPPAVLVAKLKDWAAKEAKFTTFLANVSYELYDFDNKKIALFFFPYDDTSPAQQSCVIAMNIPLFGNYRRWDESSTTIFLKDSSIENGDGKVVDLLGAYFAQIGFDSALPKELYTLAKNELNQANHQQGCLLQFFDLSGEKGQTPYQGVDGTAFVSHSFGIPLKVIQPSEVISGARPLRNNTMDLQLRLTASNYSTLNPYSFLRIKRYDTLDPQISKKILSKMKAKLKSAPVNQHKLDKHKQKLKKRWNLG